MSNSATVPGIVGALVILAGVGLYAREAIAARGRQASLKHERQALSAELSESHVPQCIDRMETYLARHDSDPSSLLASLTQTLADRGADVRSLTLQPRVSAAGCEVTPLSLTFEGRLDTVYDFLHDVASRDERVAVRRLTMQRDSVTQSADLLVLLEMDALRCPGSSR